MARDYRAEYASRIARARERAGDRLVSAREAAGHKPLIHRSTAAGDMYRLGGELSIDQAIRNAAARGNGVAFTVNRRNAAGEWRSHVVGRTRSAESALGRLIEQGGGPSTDMSAAAARESFGALDTRGGRGRPTVDVTMGDLDAGDLIELRRFYASWWALIADLDDETEEYG